MTGWTNERIKREIERRGTTIAQLSADHGLRKNALTTSLTAKQRLPTYHKIIARFVGATLHEIWPEHYPPEGHRDGRKDGKRPWAYSPEAFEALLARIEAGERYSRICRSPGVPTETALYGYRKRNPAFARRWDRAMGQRPGAPGAFFTPGQIAGIAERVAKGERLEEICAEPGQPAATTVLNHRRKDPDLDRTFREAFGRRPGVPASSDRFARFLGAMSDGTPYYKLKGLLTANTVIRLRRTDPDFAARFAEAREAGRAVLTRQASARALSPDEVWRVVENAVRHVRPEARDDIRGDLMMALLEGRVSADQAASAVRGLVTAWNREFARRDMSFDQEIGDGEGLTFSGLIADSSSYVPGGVQVIRAAW